MKNYYQTLGVQPSATNDEIKLAYKTLSKRVHPDVNWGGQVFEELFKQINEAYQVLGDAENRATYNQQYNHFFFANHAFTVRNQAAVEQPIGNPALRRKVAKNSLVCAVLLLAFLAVNAFVFHEDEQAMNAKLTATEMLVKPDIAKPILLPVVPPVEQQIATTEVVANSIEDTQVNETALVEKEVSSIDEKTDALESAGVEKKTADKEQWSETQLKQLVEAVKAERLKTNNTCKYIRLIQSANCNVSNAFQPAYYLQMEGFFIAGRETVSAPSKGFTVSASPQLIEVKMGMM
jgi:hypothetical protein